MKIKYCIYNKPNIFIRFLLLFVKDKMYMYYGRKLEWYKSKELFNIIYILERIK